MVLYNVMNVMNKFKYLLAGFVVFFVAANSSAKETQTGGFSSDMYKLELAAKIIGTYYVDTVNEHRMVEDAIVGILNKLDPHSVYIPAEEVKKMNEPLDGNFEGIGVQYQMMSDTLLVIQTISGGPSEKVGIMAGDRIVSANDTVIAGVNMSTTDIQKRLRGPKGTKVVVKVLRRSSKDTLVFNITRDKIPLYSIDASYMIQPTVGYIKVNRFSATTHDEFVEAFKKLENKGMKSLVLDLQGNGGGYLNEATKMADEFLSKDRLVVYTKGNAQPYWESKTDGNGRFLDGKLVVLVDESSASASEILSGAIQDWDRGVIVGRRTFAKGLVQKPVALNDGSMMRLTVARYYTPSGRCIQKPYDKGKENYGKDLVERYKRGELTNQDSISLPDSLKFKTKVLGRTVYGGGGIMPDVFVPIDTTKYSKYHRELVAKGVVNKFVLEFVDKNRKILEAQFPTFDKYMAQYEVSDDDLQYLVKLGEDEKVKLDSAQFDSSKKVMKLQLKALIARDLWTTSEYYQIINQADNSYLKAIEIVNDSKLYNDALGIVSSKNVSSSKASKNKKSK